MKFALGAVPPLNKDRPTGLVVKVRCNVLIHTLRRLFVVLAPCYIIGPK
jgi:hypothetical protein